MNADDRIKLTIGAQFVQIEAMKDQIEALSKELAERKRQIEKPVSE